MSNGEPELLDVRDLDFRYADTVVLQGCSFTVRPRERLAILGASGGGKSTLLRLVLGLLQPDAGSIRFGDRDIAKLTGQELNAVRQEMGMVFQSAALISSISVAKNLALPLRELTDRSRSEIATIVDEKLAMVGMEDVKEKLPSELSGGMRKRVAIARALVLEPKLVLFDEPASGLDPVATSEIDELIVGLSEAKTSCVVVTHNLASAFRIATRVALLHEGAILEVGTPEELQRSKNPVVRRFLNADSRGPLARREAS